MGEEALANEVSEMNDAFESVIKEISPEPEPEPEAKEEEIKDEVTEDKEEEEEIKEEKPADEEEEEIVDEESPKEPPAEDERDAIITELRRKLEEKESKEEPKPKEEEPPKEEPPTFEQQDFLTEDEDLEDLIQDPDKLNKVFNNIYQRAVTDTRKVLGEGVLRSIPDIVRASVDMMDRLKEMNTKFYTDNQELKPFKKVVAAVFEEVATEHPGKDMMDLLPMVAEESRKRLELHKKAVQQDGPRKSPKLPSRKRRTTIAEDKPNTDPLLNELEEMNKIIRR